MRICVARIGLLIFLLLSLNATIIAQSPGTDSSASNSDSSKLVDSTKVANGTKLPGSTKLADTSKALDSTKLIAFPEAINVQPIEISSVDTSLPKVNLDRYGDLLRDDPRYNRKYPPWIPAVRVVAANTFNWAMNRYLFNYDWARISPDTWKYNLKNGWEWDNDRFGVNFIGHPHSGNIYFNIARSNGYSFWGSFPFVLEGSVMWEYFGENTRPSINDVINTPVSGMFLGEVIYRISSNILDDRSTGGERFLRELLAGLINPPRALNRLTQGKMFRVTSNEVYQKEPLDITLSAGFHQVNSNNKFLSGRTNAILNLQLDYGDPFEVRRRKPFDLFRLRIESKYGSDKKILDNVSGYGVLFGTNVGRGVLMGISQQFDYWNNNIFELGTLGFGPGIISRISFGPRSGLYSSIHFAGVPLAGNNTFFGPDSSQYRNYNFGGGFEGKIEETLKLSRVATIGFNGYYYWIHTYVGVPGNSFIGIVKPRVTVRLFGNVSLGFEHSVYYHNRFVNTNETPSLHLIRTEQKIFLQVFIEDHRRKGQSN